MERRFGLHFLRGTWLIAGIGVLVGMGCGDLRGTEEKSTEYQRLCQKLPDITNFISEPEFQKRKAAFTLALQAVRGKASKLFDNQGPQERTVQKFNNFISNIEVWYTTNMPYGFQWEAPSKIRIHPSEFVLPERPFSPALYEGILAHAFGRAILYFENTKSQPSEYKKPSLVTRALHSCYSLASNAVEVAAKIPLANYKLHRDVVCKTDAHATYLTAPKNVCAFLLHDYIGKTKEKFDYIQEEPTTLLGRTIKKIAPRWHIAMRHRLYNYKTSFNQLFSTHPPSSERIERILRECTSEEVGEFYKTFEDVRAFYINGPLRDYAQRDAFFKQVYHDLDPLIPKYSYDSRSQRVIQE